MFGKSACFKAIGNESSAFEVRCMPMGTILRIQSSTAASLAGDQGLPSTLCANSMPLTQVYSNCMRFQGHGGVKTP